MLILRLTLANKFWTKSSCFPQFWTYQEPTPPKHTHTIIFNYGRDPKIFISVQISPQISKIFNLVPGPFVLCKLIPIFQQLLFLYLNFLICLSWSLMFQYLAYWSLNFLNISIRCMDFRRWKSFPKIFACVDTNPELFDCCVSILEFSIWFNCFHLIMTAFWLGHL